MPNYFTKIIPSVKFKSVTSQYQSYSGFLALDENGKIWIWGESRLGTLGQTPADFTVTTVWPPQMIFPADTWSQAITVRSDASFGIKTDGTLWGWGDGGLGQLGILSALNNSYATPQQIGVDNDWVFVDNHFWNTYAWKSNGDLYAWGFNSWGGLLHVVENDGPYSGDDLVTEPLFVGNYPSFDPAKPKIAFGSESTLLIRPDGTLWAGGAWGGNSPFAGNPMPAGEQVGVDNDWSHLSFNNDSFEYIVVKNDGTAYAFGQVESSDLPFSNLEPINMPVGKVAERVRTGLSGLGSVVTQDKDLYMYGANYDGTVGDGLGGPEGELYTADPPSNHWYVPPPETILVDTDVDFVETNYWAAMFKKPNNRHYVQGLNEVSTGVTAFGLPTAAFGRALAKPMRVFHQENAFASEAQDLADRVDVWQRYSAIQGLYNPILDTFSQFTLDGWNWEGGLGWAVWPPYPPAGYPSTSLLRNQLDDYDNWDFETGMIILEGGSIEDHFCYSQLEELTYLYWENVDAGDTMDDFAAAMFSNLSKLEVLEAYTFTSGGDDTLDFSNFPVLDPTSLRSITISASAAAGRINILNLPANIGTGIAEGDLDITIRKCTLDASSRTALDSISPTSWRRIIINDANVEISDLPSNTATFSLSLRALSLDQNLTDLNGMSFQRLDLLGITTASPTQTFELNRGLEGLQVSAGNVGNLSIVKSGTWSENLSPTFVASGIYIGDAPTSGWTSAGNSTLVTVNIEGTVSSLTTITIDNCSALTTITGLNDVQQLQFNLDIVDCPLLETIAGLNNLTTVGGNIRIVNSPSVNDLSYLNNITSLTGSVIIPSAIASNPGFVKISGASWLAQPAQAAKFTNGNQAILCDI
jgi:hypothetical protein